MEPIYLNFATGTWGLLQNNETTIVDLKSNERSQEESLTEDQLHTYALGYKELTGRNADFVEIYELKERDAKKRSVDDVLRLSVFLCKLPFCI